MSEQTRGQDDERDGVTLTTRVEDHGQPSARAETRHADPGEGGWRDDEGAETDTPEETGSKVGPGREDQP